MKKFFKKPILSFKDIPDEITTPLFTKGFIALAAIIASLIYSIQTKESTFFFGITLVALIYVATLIHMYLMIAYDKAACFEGKIIKIIHLGSINFRYKDLYIMTENEDYFIVRVSKRKVAYQLGVLLRVYIMPSNVIQKGSQTYNANSPLLIVNIGAEYVEEETEQETMKRKRKTKEII